VHLRPVERRQGGRKNVRHLVINSIHQHGSGRLAGLISRAMKLEGVWRKGAVRPVVMAVESGYDFPHPVRCQLRQAADRQVPQALPLKGLDGRFGFAINDTSGKARPQVPPCARDLLGDREGTWMSWSVAPDSWLVGVHREDDEERPTSSTSTAEGSFEGFHGPIKLKRQRFWKRARATCWPSTGCSSGTSAGSTKSAGAAICGRGYATYGLGTVTR
jgi:hypothetical protein